MREYDDIDQHEDRTLELLRNKLGKLLVVQVYVNKKEGFKIKFHVQDKHFTKNRNIDVLIKKNLLSSLDFFLFKFSRECSVNKKE